MGSKTGVFQLSLSKAEMDDLLVRATEMWQERWPRTRVLTLQEGFTVLIVPGGVVSPGYSIRAETDEGVVKVTARAKNLILPIGKNEEIVDTFLTLFRLAALETMREQDMAAYVLPA